MALNITTDYAIRTLVYMATISSKDNFTISGKEISEKMFIPYNYFLKIVSHLKNAGFIESYQGKRGGYALIKDPSEISLWSVICAMQDSFTINICLEDPLQCNRHAASYCKVQKFYTSIQNIIDNKLQNCTIADLIEEKEIETD